jgi:hypothetical protein
VAKGIGAEIEDMKRLKLTVRPTEEEHTRLHERAGSLGYDSLSAYLIDCGLSQGCVLPRERRTLELLLLHVRHLTATIEEEGRKRKASVLGGIQHGLLIDVTRRSSEALRLINVILGGVIGEETGEREKAA